MNKPDKTGSIGYTRRRNTNQKHSIQTNTYKIYSV